MANDENEKTRDDDYPDIVPEDTRTDLVIDAVAHVANLVPGLGSVIASVLSGWSAEKKRDRIREVISGLALRLANLQSKVSDEYVRSDEFEDLVDQTLRRVATERHESKRRLYREFLVSAINSPAPYDEQLRILRALEQLQAAHITLIRAILQEPDPRHADGISGSFDATLKRRMPGFSQEQIADLVSQLNDLRIIHLSLGGMMTARGAEDLRHAISPFGKRFVEYILAADGEEQDKADGR
jgi:hypothetical protein